MNSLDSTLVRVKTTNGRMKISPGPFQESHEHIRTTNSLRQVTAKIRVGPEMMMGRIQSLTGVNTREAPMTTLTQIWILQKVSIIILSDLHV